ncbi:hypothetical protein I6F65_15350 [Pseudoalteromonas sp. SWXJZ94C]|uniref:hypothetical protein n=1 Tax=Pseudoalteromonas sp. SWXJZ94C TaxID=2792065 RepID=UPI0018CEC18B|nr:hypothetical protein [Pseudoalteromonas sp. SWXJZ94C]MBH0058335.1 hypothetical protein [Pseudoalteromonas sp. SWXJZ94C]
MSSDEFIEHKVEDDLTEKVNNATGIEKGIESVKKVDVGMLTIGDITSLSTWILIIANEEGICLQDPRIDLNIYGEYDNSYMVIDIYESEESSNLYFFKTEDRQNPLSSLFQWLSCINYDLRELLYFLGISHFYETAMYPEIRHQGMIIIKKYQKQNK